MKLERKYSLLLSLVFILFLIVNVRIPYDMAGYLSSPIGTILIYVLALTVFVSTNILTGSLAILTAYVLVSRSKNNPGNILTFDEDKAELLQTDMLNRYNEFPETLEEKVVGRMAPIVKHASAEGANYTPNFETDLNHTSL